MNQRFFYATILKSSVNIMIVNDTFCRFLLKYEKKIFEVMDGTIRIQFAEKKVQIMVGRIIQIAFFFNQKRRLGRLRGLRGNHCYWDVRKTLTRRIQTHSRIWLKQPNLSADELTV